MKNFFASLLGKLSWEKPAWLALIFSNFKQNPKKAYSLLGCSILFLLICITGYLYYQHLPKPQLISAHVHIPNIVMDENHKQIPQPLNIIFNHETQNSIISDSEFDSFNNLSVAPLEQIGKVITKNIEISPSISGQWQWQSDKILTFMPTSPWPAGQEYTVSFSKNLFKQTYRMPEWHIKFTTIPFSIHIKDFKFFQDLFNPGVYKTSATLSFNYPVDTQNLSQHIQLFYPETNKPLAYKTSYGPGNLEAYIQAEIKPLPDHAQYLKLNLTKEIKPGTSGNPTTTAIEARLMIPDKNSVMKISKISAVIVRDNKGQPEQILTIESTAGVTTENLEHSLHVYLLPKDYPAVGNMGIQKNYAWHNPGEVRSDMLTHKVDIIPIPTEHDFETLHSFKIHSEPNLYLYVSIDKDLPSYGDYKLALPYAAIVQAPEYPKEINFLHQGSLLALTGEKKISIIVRGLPAVKFTIARVLPDEINHLITQTSGNYQNPQFINDSFNAADISTISSEIDAFDDSDKSKAQYMALDLSKYLNQQSFKLGLFLLKAEGWNPETKTTTDTHNSRLILITDMDMLVKNNADGSHDVFVQSITNGTPVADAKVDILGKNGLPIITQTTDSNGHAVIPSLKDFVDEKAPTVYVVSKDNDISFMPYDRYDRILNYSRFDTGGDVNTHKYGLNAFLFSDRGLYRPGEDIHLGMIVKGNYAASTVPGLPLELIITDPRGMTVYDKKLVSNSTGLLTEDYQPDITALTGEYSVSLYVTKDNSPDDLLGTTTVQVQDFQPDQLKITTHFLPSPTTPQGWVSPQNLKADVTLWNLFGTPAAHRRVTGKLYFSPQPLQFDAYPNYTFSDPYRDPNKPLKIFSETLTDTQTDDKGQAEFNLDLSRYAQSTYQLTLLTRGFAAKGGRGVSQTTSILVSPLSYLIGYKPDGDLNYIRQNSHRTVSFIAINPALQLIPVQNLQIKIIKLNSITTLAKQADGSYQYQTVIQEHVINQKSFNISHSGDHYILPTDQIGDYKIQITDQNNLLLSQVSFSIIGQGEHALPKNSTLTLKLDKKDYAPGDTIQMNITAPYSGSGLITVERDKVYAYKWFKMNGTNTIESIKLPADFEGTGYVTVALIRDWNSEEIFMNPLSYSVQTFSVVPDSRRLNINLDVPDRVYPGKPLDINYSTDKPGNIIIYAVDEGILQVADYQTPDPLGYYFKKQALSVDTAQIADQILPKYIAQRELSSIGGGGEQKSIASNLNPFARKVAPVVYWSGILSTDSTAHHVTYDIPDYFNGTLRVMAVAVSAEAVGSAMKKIFVKNDYILTPNIPTFVAPHDQFDVSVNVANTTKLNTPVKLSLKTSDYLEVTGNTEQIVTVPPGAEKTVIFKLKAKDLLGNTDIDFIAAVGDKSYEQKTNLSIRPVTPYRTTITSGYADSNKSFDITRILYPEFRVLKAVSSTNPLILLTGLKDYLNTYPYDCTEQLVSRAFIQLALKDQPGFADPEKFNLAYNKTIQMLRQRQTSEGSFAYWPSAHIASSNLFTTIYAADFLTEAKIRGNHVPEDMLSQVLAYLKNYAGTNPSSMSDARLHAYAIYVLTRNQIITTDYIANLQAYFQQPQNKALQKNLSKDITTVYLAAAYQMLQNTDMANKLISSYSLGSASDISDDFYNSAIMDAQYIAILANYFPEKLHKLGDNQIIPLVNNITTDQISSLSASLSALALSDYAKAISSEKSDKNLSVSAFGPESKTVEFKTTDHTGYFYQIIQSGYDKTPSTQEIKSGLEIYREYQNNQGNPVSSANLGNELEVHLRIRSTSDQYINNIAIVDLLPGGFQLVPNSIIAKNSTANYLNYYDAREDRIVFYLTATPDVQEYTYRIRAINKGTYSIPPIYAVSMYHPKITAENIGGVIVVN